MGPQFQDPSGSGTPARDLTIQTGVLESADVACLAKVKNRDDVIAFFVGKGFSVDEIQEDWIDLVRCPGFSTLKKAMRLRGIKKFPIYSE